MKENRKNDVPYPKYLKADKEVDTLTDHQE